MADYVIEVSMDGDTLSPSELDELRQIVIDYITPNELATVEISEV